MEGIIAGFKEKLNDMSIGDIEEEVSSLGSEDNDGFKKKSINVLNVIGNFHQNLDWKNTLRSIMPTLKRIINVKFASLRHGGLATFKNIN